MYGPTVFVLIVVCFNVLVKGENEVREKRQITLVCSDGTAPASQCYPGGTCGLGYRCDLARFLCCPTTTTTTTSTVCPNSYPVYGSCTTAACATANTYCYNNTYCCAACANTGTILGTCSSTVACTASNSICINNYCCSNTATTVTTTTTTNNCCFGSICPSVGIIYPTCGSNNYCSGSGSICYQNRCCPYSFVRRMLAAKKP